MKPFVSHQLKLSGSGLALGALVLACLAACAAPVPRVGVVLELEGSGADLGQACRNGLVLAQAQRAAAGKPPMDLVIRSLGATPAAARLALQSMVDDGIRFFIGAYTSHQALELRELIRANQIVFVSPAASSVELTARDDHFYRVITNNDLMAASLARELVSRSLHQRVAVFLDTDNAAYTLPYARQVVQGIHLAGGQVRELPFASGSQPDFGALARSLADYRPSAVVLVTNAADAGFIAQHLGLAGLALPLWGCAWSMSADAVRTGGRAVEGMVFVAPSDMDSPLPEFQVFAGQYQERFGTKPPFTAILSGEAFLLVAHLLDTWGPDPELVNRQLSQGLDLPGLTGMMHLDETGDMIRPLVLYGIQDGEIRRIGLTETTGGGSQ